MNLGRRDDADREPDPWSALPSFAGDEVLAGRPVPKANKGTPAPDAETATELGREVRLDAPMPETAAEAERAAGARAGGVTLTVPGAAPEIEASEDRTAATAYRSAVEVARWAFGCASSGTPPQLAPVRAAVRNLADVLAEGDRRLLTMALLSADPDHTANHAVNTAVLALTIGRRLELGRAAWLRLGMAAFLHDVGKAQVPRHVLMRCAPFGDHERALLQRHTVAGAQLLLRVPGMPSDALAAMVVAYEHHRPLEGVEERGIHAEPPCGVSRIVAACDFFDSAMHHRSHQPQPFSARGAVERLASRSGRELDPVAVGLLIEAVGLYPPGTIVRLNDHTSAVVAAPTPGEPQRPTVLRPTGIGTDSTEVDLSLEGEPVVEGVLQAWSVGVGPLELLQAWVEEGAS
jgi:hypothetical protein